ncbi:MAG: hypothetical protein JNM69_27130 [Archangium sp.]|nr:hypothetical protein [Archangium sp.]
MTNKTETDIPTLQLRVLEKIQAELSRLNEKRDETNKRLDETNERMHEGFTRLRTEVVQLRKDVDDGITSLSEEMNVGFTAFRQQNDRRALDHERRIRAIERQLARRH